MTRRIATLVFALGAAVASCSKPDAHTAAREDLEEMVKDSVGTKGNPKVSFVMEIKTGPQRLGHLQVEFDTVAFANMSHAEFAARSRQIAAFANRHYRGGTLDSVSVLSHQEMGPGAWRIVRMQTYPVGDLTNQALPR